VTFTALRPEEHGDEAALREIFVATRRGPLDASGLDAATVERLMVHQFQMQRASYRLAFPDSTWETIVADGAIVGRIVTDADDDRVLLVDIMVAPAHQRRGHGSQALGQLIARAEPRPLELSVDHGSPAEAWYRSYGFEETGRNDLQVHLVRRPRATAMAPTGVST
jgi:ribosomal protein S18 acetylase RimI-like enzyme